MTDTGQTQQDIQILKTVDGKFYVRPLSERARTWVAGYFHHVPWEINEAGWLFVRAHAEEAINAAAAAGLVRGFIAEVEPLHIGATGNAAGGAE